MVPAECIEGESQVEIDVLRPNALSPVMIGHWRQLQKRERAWDSPFLSPLWPLAVERAQGGEDRGLRVVVLSEGGRPRGYMAVRAGGVTAMAPGAPMCDYQGMVAEPGVVFDALRIAPALGVHRFDFAHMLESQWAFAPFAQGRADAWIVDLAEGYGAYAAQRRAAGVHALKDLEKKKRKAERDAGPIVFTARSPCRETFDRLFQLKSTQLRATGQTDVFAAGWPLRLAQGLYDSRESDFGGALFTLHIGGTLAAIQFHLMGERTVHAWMITHDEAFDRFSPGLLLFHEILKWMDGQPYERMDFGPGDYRFKRELSNARQGVMHGFVGVPSPATLVRGAAYGVRRAAEALPLGPVSALPGKAMRRLDLLRGLR
jgi:CelD/BcsL family acetyltransferase involved in cellulose biosynthesis